MLDSVISFFYKNDESPIEKYFRIEFGRDYNALKRMNIKPTDKIITNIIEGRKHEISKKHS